MPSDRNPLQVPPAEVILRPWTLCNPQAPEIRIGADGAFQPLSWLLAQFDQAARTEAEAWFLRLLTQVEPPAGDVLLVRATSGPMAGAFLRFEPSSPGAPSGLVTDFLSHLVPLRRALGFIDHPHLGTWLLDRPSGALDVDGAWAAMLGYDLDALQPFTHEAWVALTQPEDAAGFNEPDVETRLTRGEVVHYLSRSRHAKGHWVWLLSCCRGALWSPEGALLRIIGYDIDITEHRSLMARTEDQRALMQRILDVMPSGQLVVDGGGIVTFLNPEAAELLGVTVDRATGQRFVTLMPLEVGAEALAAALVSDIPVRNLPLVLRQSPDARHDQAVRQYLSSRDEAAAPVRRYLTAHFTKVPAIGKTFVTLTDVTRQEDARRHLEQAVEQARFIATHDLMTGLPDRYDFLHRLSDALAQAEPSMRSLAVMMIDLDDFKLINDGMGHEAGDQLLKAAATRLGRGLPDRARLARFGGDEFVLMMPDCTPAEAAILADELRDRFHAPLDFSRRNSTISCSIGIGIFPFDSRSAEGLLRCADLAMYEAKALGRGQIQRFSPELSRRKERRTAIRLALQRALAASDFQIVLQPKFDLAHLNRPIGAEVLVRLNDPELGTVSPAEFIPVAETQDLIPSIDREVVRMVAELRKAWWEAGIDLPLSVNLSPLTLAGAGFGDLLEALPLLAGKGGLVVEVTETSLMGRLAEVRETLHLLRHAGVGIAIDDFGIGHSSLAYLQSLPIQELKIDRSFVAGLGGRVAGGADGKSNAIVRAILAMADALGLDTIAEGVETTEQANWLIDHGCTRAQGFLLGRPVDPREFRRIYLDPEAPAAVPPGLRPPLSVVAPRPAHTPPPSR